MTKVWVVSGFVLIATGLALAGFGSWLSGNANCDAGDLGRSCMAASLGVAVIGAALTLAGWLRVRRAAQRDAGTDGTERFVERRPGMVLAAFSLVGLLVLVWALPGPQIPVDVFRGGFPEVGAAPGEFAAPQLAGLSRTYLSPSGGPLRAAVEAGYEGDVFVRVTRFNASGNWTPPPSNWIAATNTPPWDGVVNASVSNATASADAYLSTQYTALDAGEGSRICVRSGARLWLTQDGEGRSELAWRAGTFVFEVIAPNKTVRDQVALALSAPRPG